MRLGGFLLDLRIVLALVVVLLAVPAWPSDLPVNRATLKGVDSMSVQVESPGLDAERDGLTKSQIQTDVELRLRESGIRVSPSPDWCFLNVNVTTYKTSGDLYAFHISLEFNQWVMLVRDPDRLEYPGVTTWSHGTIGAASASRLPEVRSQVIDLVDKFIAAYLEQNPKK